MQVLQRNLHIVTDEMKANHFDSVLNNYPYIIIVTS